MSYMIATLREVTKGREVFWDVCVENGLSKGKDITSRLEDGPLRGGYKGIIRIPIRIFDRRSSRK